MYVRAQKSAMKLIDAVAADTEYELELEAGIRDFDLFARVATAVLKYSWTSGEVTKATGGLYSTIPAGERGGEAFIKTPRESNVNYSRTKLKLYVAASVITEIEVRIFYEL